MESLWEEEVRGGRKEDDVKPLPESAPGSHHHTRAVLILLPFLQLLPF